MGNSPPLFGDLLIQMGLITPRQLEEALALQNLSGQRVGESLVSLGYVTRDQLQGALISGLGLTPSDDRPPLGQLLLGLKYINSQTLDKALALQKLGTQRLGDVLVEMGACTFKQVYEALALQQRLAGQTLTTVAKESVAFQTRVLVVDDSPLACSLVEGGLSALGYEVVTFQDPFQALEEVFHLRPSIVLSDLSMPGIDGIELCRRLKEGPAHSVPVILLTASDTDSERVGGLRAGADDYVSKGASMEELSARIESVMRRTGETERMRKLFARYTSDAVVEEILKAPGEVILTGEKREATLLFADIRNFTSLSEGLDPEVVVGLLNRVLGRLSDAVLTCGGTLDKFLGDGLMAVFGAPVRRDDDALRAVQAARMMMDAAKELQAEVLAEGGPSLELGIGINSGPVVVGNIGSAQRTEYTCIGDAVNVASRLCGLAEAGQILVGARTRELVGEIQGFEPLPPVRLKGKLQPVPLFRAVA